jgi:glycosyltransferase involved in cell wall biosynthesis
VRILVVSQMYPGPKDPDLGIFVQRMEQELVARGNDVQVVAVTHRGGSPFKHLSLGLRTIVAALRMRPDAIYAHFLAPAGVWAMVAALLTRSRLVVTAHGRDVRNIGERPGVGLAMRLLARRADAVVAVSGYLRDDLERRVPALRGRVRVIDSGVDLSRFSPFDQGEARRNLGIDMTPDEPLLLFVGTLDERKNVVHLADAFERLGRGQLIFVGDGPLRNDIEDRANVRVVGRVPHDEVPRWMHACDVLCLPSTVEPFGQVLLEAMACERSVVATSIGGPPEFVTEDAGAIVDPGDVDSIERGIRRALELPRPNTAARQVAARHDVAVQAERVEQLLAGR